MFWSGLRLSTEDILGSVHCLLRARRVDFDRSAAWDDLWRGTLNPPHEITDSDLPWWTLTEIAHDLRPLRAETRPYTARTGEGPASVLGSL
jgi:hypothetical protein